MENQSPRCQHQYNSMMSPNVDKPDRDVEKLYKEIKELLTHSKKNELNIIKEDFLLKNRSMYMV